MFTVKYLGDLRTEAEHLKSKTKINTDAPIDNHGKGECFSPTDLLCVALGSCIITTMGIKSKSIDENIENSLKGTLINIKKIMSFDTPRRITKITIELNIPFMPKDQNEKNTLEELSLSCPVSRALTENIKQEIIFNWGNKM